MPTFSPVGTSLTLDRARFRPSRYPSRNRPIISIGEQRWEKVRARPDSLYFRAKKSPVADRGREPCHRERWVAAKLFWAAAAIVPRQQLLPTRSFQPVNGNPPNALKR